MPVVDDAVAVAVAVAIGFDAGVSGRCGVATRAQSTPRARAVHEAWPRPEGETDKASTTCSASFPAKSPMGSRHFRLRINRAQLQRKLLWQGVSCALGIAAYPPSPLCWLPSLKLRHVTAVVFPDSRRLLMGVFVPQGGNAGSSSCCQLIS